MRAVLSKLLFVAFVAAIADGAFAFRAAVLANASMPASIAALVVAAAAVACPLVVVALGLAAFARAARRLLADLRSAWGTVVGGDGALGAAVASIALAVAATRASIVGRHVVASMSASFAATAVVVLTVGFASLAVLGSVVVSRVVAPHLLAAERRWPRVARLSRGGISRAICAVSCAAALEALLPRELVVAPTAALAAWIGIGGLDARGGTGRHRAPRAFAIALVALTFVAPLAVARLPGRARSSAVERPPYGSLLFAVARKLVDRDGDGYSPVLGGGDCDDDDPTVHPGAPDLPGDGRDQNCSGADSVPLAAVPPPVVAVPTSAATHPSFVIVLVDALRPDHLHFAGYPRATSPALDRFRETATWFRRTYAPAPSTRFSLTALFTGRDPTRVPHTRGLGTELTLSPEARTIAEQLDEVGYDRVGLPIGYVVEHMPGMGQGFRVWAPPWAGLRDEEVAGRDATMTTDAALAYLRASDARQRPYLLYLHYACTHAPYVAHAEHEFGDSERDAYDSALAYCDDEIGRLLGAVDSGRDRDRTVVVLLSDHGELFGEHGVDRHGTSLLEPAVRSLLLVRVPGMAPATVDATVTLSDIAPTLLALAGRPDDRAWSLLPYLAGVDVPARPMPLFVDDRRGGVHFEARAVVDGRLKLVRDLASGAEALFDLEADPNETTNLRRALPGDFARLGAMVDVADAPSP